MPLGILRNIFFILCIFACSACTTGLIYTDVTEPLTKNMHKNIISGEHASSSRKIITEPITGINLRGEWSNYAIGRTAKENGIDIIQYADIRTRSYLLGIWEKTTVTVYGSSNERPSETIAVEINQ